MYYCEIFVALLPEGFMIKRRRLYLCQNEVPVTEVFTHLANKVTEWDNTLGPGRTGDAHASARVGIVVFLIVRHLRRSLLY